MCRIGRRFQNFSHNIDRIGTHENWSVFTAADDSVNVFEKHILNIQPAAGKMFFAKILIARH